MRKTLRLLALLLFLAGAGFWAATGANRGWSKTSVPVKTVDEVTGIEGINYQKKFVPGLEFLGAVLGGSAILAGISFAFKNKNKPLPSNP